MSSTLDNALKRLKFILPLEQRLKECSRQIAAVHQSALRSFVTRGRILSREEIRLQVSNIDEAVAVLQDSDLMVFSAQGDPVGVYPFTTESRGHKVAINKHLVNAMCALDTLAVSPMFGFKTQISSSCRVSGKLINISQSGQTIENLDETGKVHLGINWGAEDPASKPADSLCLEMVFLLDSEMANQWHRHDQDKTEIFNLQEAVEFASEFFVPLVLADSNIEMGLDSNDRQRR